MLLTEFFQNSVLHSGVVCPWKLFPTEYSDLNEFFMFKSIIQIYLSELNMKSVLGDRVPYSCLGHQCKSKSSEFK